ncbi:hypothetical protein IPF37_00905 [bacterium]|nr:MAG: hypothetical protein IPF37_00905 [bacterium]
MSKKLVALAFSFSLICSSMNVAAEVVSADQFDVVIEEQDVALIETVVQDVVQEIIEKVEKMKEAGATEEEVVEQVTQEVQAVADTIAEHGFAGLRNKEKGLYFAAGVATTLIVAGVVFGVKKYFFDKKSTGNAGTAGTTGNAGAATGNAANGASSTSNASTADAGGVASSSASN